jgi:hypothetical protein
LQDNVIRFSQPDEVSSSPRDLVFIRNESTRQVRFLRVRAGDMFLVFEWPASETAVLLASSRTHGVFVAVDGLWDDGTAIAVSEDYARTPAGKATEYSILLKDNGVFLHRRPLS